jgi:hypothetical protein
LGPNQSGMIGVIDKSIPNQQLVIRCTGEIIKGVEDYDGPGAKAVDGALESYTLTPQGTKTLLTVELSGGNFPPDMMDFFIKVWPKALDALKQIAEA